MKLQHYRKWLWSSAILGIVGAAAPAMATTYLVKFKSVDATLQAATEESFAGTKVLDSHVPARLLKVDLTTANLDAQAQGLKALMQDPRVEYVVEDFPLRLLDQVPAGDKAALAKTEQWALDKVRASEAWKHGGGSRQVVVAVIDTGTDIKHENLAENIYVNTKEIPGNGIDDDKNGFVDDVNGWNFIDNNNNVTDVTQSGGNPGHGTHCAGIIGSLGKGSGTSGISQQISIMPLRFIGPDGQGDLMAAIKAIDYAIQMKVDAISASWGAQVDASQAQPLIEAIGRANTAGVTFVAAAGNDGAVNDTTPMYPANTDAPNVIAVAASDANDGKPSWSNYGKAKVALASPGADIMSTLPGNKHGKLSGTSMATPLVAGLIGLLRGQNLDNPAAKSLGTPEIKSLLQTTGTSVEIETACMCRIDAAAAAEALKNNKLLVVPAAATLATGATVKLSAIGGSGGYKFASANPEIADVGADGTLTAKGNGETTVTVTDAHGDTAKSLSYHVGTSDGGSTPGQPDPGTPPAGCPLKDPAQCQLLCIIMPNAPWCKK